MGFLLIAYGRMNAIRRKHQIQYELMKNERKAARAKTQLGEISDGIQRQITQLKNNAQVQAANYKNQVYQNLQAQMTDPNDQNAASQVQAQFAQFSAQVDAQLAHYTGTVLPQYEDTLNAQFLEPAKEEDQHLQSVIDRLNSDLKIAEDEEKAYDPSKEVASIIPKLGGGN